MTPTTIPGQHPEVTTEELYAWRMLPAEPISHAFRPTGLRSICGWLRWTVLVVDATDPAIQCPTCERVIQIETGAAIDSIERAGHLAAFADRVAG